ncbi:MAG: helix-turn-helix transcriptional regulator [Armatimonadetes bacterium]|nr:helix-turn-helix transcriptional regulator [Armatimonadota bacterium]
MSTQHKDEPVYMISIAARLCHMHPQTLRLYERLGLVQPQRRNGRNRLYSEEDIQRLQQIQRLTQDLGVNLAGVEVILGLLERLKQTQEEAENRMDEMRREFEAEIRHFSQRG